VPGAAVLGYPLAVTVTVALALTFTFAVSFARHQSARDPVTCDR